ncbi:MATE family efflux transporter [Clostridium formicaceticum]|uniref:Multidrug export protein MepA n=1 Tax=Clostridium formicaceticum TaxID=1497 RepID=A0AAC9RM51_9CLOT|nr:MATE family efflux transporter [Clostridium formicaceticum]AOY77964.1 MATE family efflux transporter [Clostridium formicaceticum]ARE88586.1 Multidrug export protein MepA [Clostridium formicaceticum]
MERNHRLGNEKMTKLLMNLSLPATVAMLVNAFYNIVDTIFIGRGIGYLAIGGLTIAFPIQMMIMAIAQMIGIGAASVVSRSLGSGNKDRANHVVGNSFLSVGILGILICVSGLIAIEPLLRIFGATDILLPYSKEYLQVILIGSIYFPFAVCGNNLIRAEGNAKTAMFSMLIGAIANIILDYLFIFPLNMGIAGAALATILSQLLSVIYVLVYILGKQTTFKIKLYHLKPDKKILYEIVTVGFASFARQVAGSIMAIILNHSLALYGGELAISVYGVIQRIIMFLFMPMFGIVQGMQPIVGYNYGANKINRVKEVVKLSIIATTLFASVSTLFGELFPNFIIGMFDNDPNLIKNGVFALKIVIAMVPIIGIQIVGAALFQSLGKAIPSLLLTLSRQVLFFIPLLLVLPRIYGLGLLGIWITFPLADFLSTIFTVVLMRKEMKLIEKQGSEATS